MPGLAEFLRQCQLLRRRIQELESASLQVGADEFSVSEVSADAEIRNRFETKTEEIVFAEDGCGNHFASNRGTGCIYFWDHETEERTLVADSLKSFVESLAKSEEVELHPGQVEEVWIDPDLLKRLKQESTEE